MPSIHLIKNLSASRYEEATFSSDMVGQLSFTKTVNGSGVALVTCTNVSTGLTQTLLVDDVANEEDAVFTLLFDVMGIQVSGETTVDYTHTLFDTIAKRTNAIADAVCTASDVHVRAAVPVDVTIPFGAATLPARTDADLSLGDYQGWVLYDTPTQSDLTADTAAPNNKWQPYYGDFGDVPLLSTAVVTEIKADAKAPLTLPSGTEANSFTYTWGEFDLIDDTKKQGKYDGTPESVTFTFENETTVPSDRLTLYVNGQYKTLSGVTVSKNVVDCSGLTINLGDKVTVILKAYSPTTTELAFDPDANPTSDNPLQTTQYKYDYQYTVREIRNDSGVLTNTLYYFWVKNKNLATKGRSMSIQSAKNALKQNTDPYVILQNITNPSGTSTPYYNQVIGVGLNNYVTEDDTYKVRFTRDFILRDDPRNIQLKNVHTEWTLIREQQNTLIPKQLWDILTDAACGFSAVGDPVPSLANIAYDERNGTRTRYGFESGQAFVDQDLALNSIKYAILNTSLTAISQANGGQEVPDPISFIDASNIEDLFSTSALIRQTMNNIWANAKPKQVNEIFFTVLYDALAENYEFTDIFKTSMIAAHSIRLFATYGLTQ